MAACLRGPAVVQDFQLGSVISLDAFKHHHIELLLGEVEVSLQSCLPLRDCELLSCDFPAFPQHRFHAASSHCLLFLSSKIGNDLFHYFLNQFELEIGL